MAPPTPVVSAVIVTVGATPFLADTLAALRAQTQRPDHLYVVDVADNPMEKLPVGYPARDTASVLPATEAANFGQALQRVLPTIDPGEFLWLLHDDSAPHPDCLAEQLRVFDQTRTASVVGPKQLGWSKDNQLLSAGIAATKYGERLDLEGEIDQGQHDGVSDVLGVGTAGMLVRSATLDELEGFDPFLGPFGDGLEFCRRVRRAGHLVLLAPAARIRHAQASYWGQRTKIATNDSTTSDSAATAPAAASVTADSATPAATAVLADQSAIRATADATELNLPAPDRDKSAAARRTAELYLRCLNLPTPLFLLFPLYLLAVGVVASVREIFHGTGHGFRTSWQAIGRIFASATTVAEGRQRCAQQAKHSRAILRPLEVTSATLRAMRRTRHREQRLAHAPEPLEPVAATNLRNFRHRGRLAAAFLLVWAAVAGMVFQWGSWQTLTGGARLVLPPSFTALWTSLWAGWVPGGDGFAGPIDPFTWVRAVAVSPFAFLGQSPTQISDFLWLLVLPVAAFTAWWGAGVITRHNLLRLWLAAMWVSAPSFLIGAAQGRQAAVAFHLALPAVLAAWARLTGAGLSPLVDGAQKPVAVERPAGRGAGWLAVALVVAAGAYPVFLPLATLAAVFVPVRTPRGRRRLFAATLPSWVLSLPLLAHIAQHPGARWPLLLAPADGPVPSTLPAAWWTALGVPLPPSTLAEFGWATNPVAQWLWIVPGALAALAAVVALLRSHRPVIRLSWLAAVASLVLAFFAQHTLVATVPQPVTIWAGPALALSYGALLFAAGYGLDPAGRHMRVPRLKPFGAGVAAVSLLGTLVLGTLGATVTAMPARTDQVNLLQPAARPATPAAATYFLTPPAAARLLVLTPGEGTTVAAALWRCAGPCVVDDTTSHQLTAAHQLQAGKLDPASSDLAGAVATALVGGSNDLAEMLANHGIDQVLVPAAKDTRSIELAARLGGVTGLEELSASEAGTVWRVAVNATGGPATLAGATRVVILSGDTRTPVPAGTVTVHTTIPAGIPGRELVLAERADSGWWATLDGEKLEPIPAGWQQRFKLPAAGGDLKMGWTASWLWPWRLAVLAAGLATFGSLLPLRRGR